MRTLSVHIFGSEDTNECINFCYENSKSVLFSHLSNEMYNKSSKTNTTMSWPPKKDTIAYRAGSQLGNNKKDTLFKKQLTH